VQKECCFSKRGDYLPRIDFLLKSSEGNRSDGNNSGTKGTDKCACSSISFPGKLKRLNDTSGGQLSVRLVPDSSSSLESGVLQPGDGVIGSVDLGHKDACNFGVGPGSAILLQSEVALLLGSLDVSGLSAIGVISLGVFSHLNGRGLGRESGTGFPVGVLRRRFVHAHNVLVQVRRQGGVVVNVLERDVLSEVPVDGASEFMLVGRAVSFGVSLNPRGTSPELDLVAGEQLAGSLQLNR